MALSFANAALTALIFVGFNFSVTLAVALGHDYGLQTLWSPVLASVVTFVLTPLAPPVMAIAPWVLQLALTGNPTQSIVVALLAHVAYARVYSTLLSWFYNHRSGVSERNHEAHFVHLTHLAFFLGISAFGIHGLVVGPLCVCVADSSIKFLIKRRRAA